MIPDPCETARPRRYFRDQRAGGSAWAKLRIRLGSIVMGQKAWQPLYRSILELAEHDRRSVARLLDEKYAEQQGWHSGDAK